LRGAADIVGQITRVYVITIEDLGLMVGYRAVGTNAGGSATAEALPVGPIEAAPPRRKR
jgi:hypothetical protein